MRIIPPKRHVDEYGSGAYLAPRGKRDHNGIDLACYPASEVVTHVSGRVTKLGYPYSDDLRFRYVQITDDDGYQHRFFYVEPSIFLHAAVKEGDVIGTTQKLGDRYPRITEHVHYEVKKGGEHIDPEEWL